MAQTKSLRQKQEEREHQILGPFASYADESGGRDHEERSVISERIFSAIVTVFCTVRHFVV